MIQRLRAWLRVVLPADWTIFIFFGLLGGAYLVTYARSWLDDSDAWESLDTFRILLVGFTAAIYGFFRAIYFHPAENRHYGRWLKASPWRLPDPLPLGPLNLVWQDALIVALLTALFPGGSVWRLYVASLFLVAYSFSISFSHWRIGIDWVILINAFLAGVLMLVILSPIKVLVVAAFACVVSHVGTRQMLRMFPFHSRIQEWLKLSPQSTDREASAGWPLSTIEHGRWSWSMSHARAACVALCVGWLQFCLQFQFRDLPKLANVYMTLYLWVVIFFVLGRLWLYCMGYAPPISFLGRLATGRLVIPGYDIVLLAPLVTAVVAYVLPEILAAVGMHPSTVFPVSSSVVAWLALALPPAREAWHLTGHHRVAYRFLAAMATRSQTKVQR
jgi:hypothetical protein